MPAGLPSSITWSTPAKQLPQPSFGVAALVVTWAVCAVPSPSTIEIVHVSALAASSLQTFPEQDGALAQVVVKLLKPQGEETSTVVVGQLTPGQCADDEPLLQHRSDTDVTKAHETTQDLASLSAMDRGYASRMPHGYVQIGARFQWRSVGGAGPPDADRIQVASSSLKFFGAALRVSMVPGV